MNLNDVKVNDTITLHQKATCKNITTGYNMFIPAGTTLVITKIQNNVISAEVKTPSQIYGHVLEFGPNEYPGTVQITFGEKS